MLKDKQDREAKRAADEATKRKGIDIRKLDDEWEMVGEDEDWEKVTVEEADDSVELVSSSGASVSVLNGGLQ